MPLWAYRHGAGWLLGRTFIYFIHVGRSSGRRYDTVAMVLRDDPATREVVVCAAWGPGTDWYRNLQAGPAGTVQIGHDRYLPQQRFLTDAEAFDVAAAFGRAHPHRLHLMQSVLGWGDLDQDDPLRDFVAGHPMLAFSHQRTA